MSVYMSLVQSMSSVDRHCGGTGGRGNNGQQQEVRSPRGFGMEVTVEMAVSLTVKSKAGMGVQRLMWIMARRLGRWPSLAPAKNNLQEMTS